jgi:hypothetical protein
MIYPDIGLKFCQSSLDFVSGCITSNSMACNLAWS